MKTVTLGEVLASRAGTIDPSKFPDEQFDLYSIPAYDCGDPEIISGSEIGSAKQVVRPGDILLSRIVPHIRRAWVVGREHGRRTIASSEWIVFRSEDVYPPWLRHMFLSDQFHRHFMATVAGVGGSLMRARPAHVATISVQLPPLSEQRRIASILDHADALRAKRRQVIAHLDDLAQSIFLEMFGAPDSWPNRWPMGLIGDMATDVQYGTSSKAGDVGKWPIARMGNVTDGGRLDLTDLKWIDLTESEIPKFTVRRGDLLFNRTNSKEKVGKTCVVTSDEPLAFAGYLVRVRLKPEHRVEFVNAYMTSRYGQALRRSMAKAAVNQANINAREMQSMPIALPPAELQRDFAAALAQVDVQRDDQLAALTELDALFSSLQSRAFRGEL